MSFLNYTVEESLNILQSTFCLRRQDSNVAANLKVAMQRIMNPNWRTRQVKLNGNNIVKISSWSDPRVYFCNYTHIGHA